MKAYCRLNNRNGCGKPNNDSGNGIMVLALTEKKTRGRVRRASPNKKEQREMVLAVRDLVDKYRGNWISTAAQVWHLVNDETLLIYSAACDHEITMIDGESINLTQVRSVRFKVVAYGVEITVMLTGVSPRWAKNTISNVKARTKRLISGIRQYKRALARRNDDAIAVDVVMRCKVLYVDVTATEERHGVGEAILEALELGATMDATSDAQNSQLQHAMNNEDRDVTARDSIPSTASQEAVDTVRTWHTCIEVRAGGRDSG